MKGLIKLFAVTTIICMIPFTAFSMQMISENEMDAITGQSGITIVFSGNAADDTALSIKVSLLGMSWGDSDGIGGSTSKGFFTMNGVEDDGTTLDHTELTIKIKHLTKMTIDVASTGTTVHKINGSDLLEAQIPIETTFMKLGLPDLTLSLDMAKQGILSLADESTGGNSQEMGRLSLNDLKVSLDFPLNSALYIYAH
jgi:hypothetical protein